MLLLQLATSEGLDGQSDFVDRFLALVGRDEYFFKRLWRLLRLLLTDSSVLPATGSIRSRTSLSLPEPGERNRSPSDLPSLPVPGAGLAQRTPLSAILW